jgi:hypothetical protein
MVETLLEIDKEDIVVDAFAFHSNDRGSTKSNAR